MKLVVGEFKLNESELEKRFGTISLILELLFNESFSTLRGCNVAKCFFDLLLNSWKNPCQGELAFEVL